MYLKILLALVVVQQLLLAPYAIPARAQEPAPGASTQPKGNVAPSVWQVALERMAAGDTQGAMRLLRSTAGKSSGPLEAQRAQCLEGAAFAMNAEPRSSEHTARILSRPPEGAAVAAWQQMLTECRHRLRSIADRLKPDRRAVLFYYLGLIGTDEAEHIRDLREAVKLFPQFSEADYQLGLHLLGNGQLAEAAEIFRRVAQQRPQWADPHSHLGTVLTLTGRPAEAIRELEQALKLRPEFTEAHGQLCLALYATGDYNSALAHGGRAADKQPRNPFHHNCTALVLLEKNQSLEALTYARRSAELAPGHETYQVVLAAALEATGSQQEALTAMQRALAAQPALRTDPTRLEKANLLRGRALQFARQVLQKAISSPQAAGSNP